MAENPVYQENKITKVSLATKFIYRIEGRRKGQRGLRGLRGKRYAVHSTPQDHAEAGSAAVCLESQEEPGKQRALGSVRGHLKKAREKDTSANFQPPHGHTRLLQYTHEFSFHLSQWAESGDHVRYTKNVD